jgi:NAD(P)-dependent dehydrogenase (short-subunit alcohol dehydrogenase family)
MRDRVAIVTGANTGIGKETARALAKRGGRVILACRSVEKAMAAIAEIERTSAETDLDMHAMRLDLGSLSSVRAFVDEFEASAEAKLDILVLNAGVMGVAASLTMRVNHVGHFLLANLLLPRMARTAAQRKSEGARAPRVIVVSSDFQKYGDTSRLARLQRYVDPNGGAELANTHQAYCDSKLANVLFASELQRRADAHYGAGTLVSASLHPGGIITEITRNWIPMWAHPFVRLTSLFFLKTTREGAMTTTHAALATELEPPRSDGLFYDDCAAVDPNAGGALGANAANATAARLLWEDTAALVGGAFDAVA